ncbi:O-antigen ligase [Deinococcus sp. NW-56]|uniref:O-antigen ligase family protein n=1 Tax=Deinococcus sp. NW-56 TaxID=2080419 RepID=UPI00131A148A|nr:O-antigen ligase family protein [Deinococcus sp. NW-56]
MSAPSLTQAASPPFWVRVWLALLAPLYVLSPLALLALPALRRLPRAAWILLGIYAVSQQLPALLAPAPIEASVLALTRTLLLGGLMGAGVMLGRSGRLMPLGVGLLAVLATAVVVTVVSGVPLIGQRLSHPYMTSITLGLAGACGLWLGLFGSGHRGWRVLLGGAGVALLLLSASRAPLLAALIGVGAGVLVRADRRVALVSGGILAALGALVVLGIRNGDALTQRLIDLETNGRDLVWAGTLSVIQSSPLGGVGPYLLGRFLQPPSAYCELWIGPGGTSACPEWVSNLGSPWLIAHNGVLQPLAESGPLGVLGLFLLLGAVVWTALRTRDALSTAVLVGLLVATATDNTLIVPSPFFGEVFWIVAGIQLGRLEAIRPAHGWIGGGLLAALAFPVWAASSAAPPDFPGRLLFVRAAPQVSTSRDYTVYSQWALPPGQRYRLLLRSCTQGCAIVNSTILDTSRGPQPSLALSGEIRNVPEQRLQLQVYPARAGLQPIPLATHEWTVRLR